MDRTQALRLWHATLALKEVSRGAAGEAELRPLWAEAGLTAADTAPLVAALQVEDDLERRHQLIRRTRLLLLQHGYNPDLLSTPAAEAAP
jgi:hypothetical protein